MTSLLWFAGKVLYFHFHFQTRSKDFLQEVRSNEETDQTRLEGRGEYVV